MTPLDSISQLTDENEQLRSEIERLENLTASGIHTCHADCQRPMCVLRRERDKALADLARVTAELDAARAEAVGNAASFRDADARRAENYRLVTTVQGERDVAKRDLVALRARVAELVAALRALLALHDPDGKFEPHGNKPALAEARAILARAEGSASPAKHPDTERLDWLEAQPSKYEWAVTLDHGCVFVTRNKTSGRPSIRAAIDAARKHGGAQ